jgi:hypothetical protein
LHLCSPDRKKGKVLRKVGKEVLGRRFERIGAWKKEKKLLEITKTFLPLQSQNEGMLERAKRRAGRTGE